MEAARANVRAGARPWLIVIVRQNSVTRSDSNTHYAAVHARADEILQYVWDPIGVGRMPEARDEYGAYVPQVVRLLFEEKPEAELVAYLHQIESGHMGLSETPEALAHTQEVAALLIQHYRHLKNA